MNEREWSALRVVVERVVRPLAATDRRKRALREELLGHLAAVYAEELAGGDDPQAALARAVERFGDTAELTAQLQSGLPRSERFLCRIEARSLAMDRWIHRRPGESIVRCSARGALMIFALFATTLLVLSPAALLLRGLGHGLAAALPLLGGMVLLMSAASFALIALGYALFEALYDPAGRSAARAATIASLAAAVGPAVTAALGWLTAAHRPETVPSLCGVALMTAILIPVVLVLAVRQKAEELRYEREWSSLDIGP